MATSIFFSSAATCTHLRPIEWPPVATSIFFSSAATCSHLQPIEWLPVAASGRQSKWPQVAASGRKWPPEQVAASGRQVAARASGRKWPQVAASGRLCQNQIRFPSARSLKFWFSYQNKLFLHWFGNFHFAQARQVYYQLWCFLVGQ